MCYCHMLFKKEICFISSFKYILFIYLMHQASVTARGIFVVSWGVFRCHVWALVVALGPRSAQPSVVAAQGLSSVACGILVFPWRFQKKKTLEECSGLGQLPGEVGLPGWLLSACPPTPRGGGGVFGALQATPRDLQLQGGRAGRSQANIPGLAESLGGPRESSPSQRDLQCVELGPAACHLCVPQLLAHARACPPHSKFLQVKARVLSATTKA